MRQAEQQAIKESDTSSQHVALASEGADRPDVLSLIIV